MKKSILLSLLCCVVSSAVAQRQTVTEDWGQDPASEIYIPACALPGKITYSYIIDEEGNVLKDGPLSIKCSVVNEKTVISPYTITVNGNYTLNTTYSNGYINGPFSSNYTTDLVGYIIISKDAVSVGSTMTGTFSKGIPNGAFKVTRKGDYPTTLTANFKNGKLVGAFSCSMKDEDMYDQKYSGTLTQDGKFTGKWQMLNGRSANGQVSYEFSNGVLISETRNNKATKPAISALARKYANGELTEEQLFEQGCIVLTETVELGDLVRIAVLRDAAVNFKELGGYDFSEPNHIEYKWLKEIASMTDAGVELLVKGIREYVIDNSHYTLGNLTSSSEFSGQYGGLMTDENGNYYVVMHKNQNKGYAKGGFEGYDDNVYLSDAQKEYVDQQIYQIILESVCSLQDFASKYYLSKLDKSNANFCETYFKEGSSIANFQTIKEIENARSILGKVYEDCIDDTTYPLPMDPNITVITYRDRKKQYIYTESIVEYKKILDGLEVSMIDIATNSAITFKEYFIDHYKARHPEITAYLNDGDVSGLVDLDNDELRDVMRVMKDDCARIKLSLRKLTTVDSLSMYNQYIFRTESVAEYEKAVDDLEACVQAGRISRVFDYMVANKTPLAICYGENNNYFYSSQNSSGSNSANQTWRLSFESALKKFGRQFVGYEIISINDTTIDCKLQFTDKKKVVNTWQITLEYKNNRICVESFDINKATKLE